MGLIYEDLGNRILSAAVEVHKCLGPGLLESTYEACLFHQLTTDGLSVLRQVELPVHFKGVRIDAGYRLNLLVEDSVIIELKAVEQIAAIHEAQLHTYLRLSGKKLGYLLNFNTRRRVDGIVRRVN